MSVKRLGLAACAALSLAACSIGKPVPQATTYVVDPPMTAAASPAARRPETLRMGNVRVAAAYAGNALVYRLDDVQYTSDPYHAFIAEPGAMLGNRMAEWLDRAGPFKTVAQPGSATARTRMCSRLRSPSSTAISARDSRPRRCWPCSSR